MAIRLLSSIAGTPAYECGAIVVLTPEVERAWIDAGLAEPVSEVGYATAALTGGPERAVRRRGKAREVPA